jgi:hypothetical protein
MNKIKNKRILKNNAIGGYIYDKTQNKWKWKLFGKQNGGVKLPHELEKEILSYVDCESFYKSLLEIYINNMPLYRSLFTNEIFIDKLVICTIQWRQLISSMYTHPYLNIYKGFGLKKNDLIWYKMPGSKYISGKVSEDWIPHMNKSYPSSKNYNKYLPIINQPNSSNKSIVKKYKLSNIYTLIPNIFAIDADFAEMLNNRIEEKSNDFPINSMYSNGSKVHYSNFNNFYSFNNQGEDYDFPAEDRM